MTGDKVRVINNRSSHCFKIGAIVKVIGLYVRQYPYSYLCEGKITDDVTGKEAKIEQWFSGADIEGIVEIQQLQEADIEEIN